MTHQAQLANVKYRNWVRAGLGIKYVKGGLEPFCDDLATQQHSDILNRIKLKHNLSAVSCGYCNVHTLQPNHIRDKNKQCPLAQTNCNCQYPGGKVSCPNNVCGAIYDKIIQLHASIPPVPYWENTDASQWCTEPWSVAKCFINAPGYGQKTKANELDCCGLLHVLINNKGFQQHIKCKISGTDVISRVRKSRNEIFHSYTMELEDNEVNSYIDDMIELLEDETELKHRQDSKDAVKKLIELKQKNFAISTTDEDEIRHIASDAIKEIQQTKTDAIKELGTTTAESEKKIEQKGIEIEKQLTKKQEVAEEKIEQKLHESRKQLEDIAVAKLESEKSRQKADFQKNLIKLYKQYVCRTSALPLNPEKTDTNVDDIYVPPLMTVDIKDGRSKKWKEVQISMEDIFKVKEEPEKAIYIIGEAGSGKSMFCKILVHFWCIAHSYPKCSLDESDIVKVMKRFIFLFYVPLRQSDCNSIEEMLELLYHDHALGNILQNESDKCLIILDGLDEWAPERTQPSAFLTTGLPGRKLDADYTIVTTSRQWKFDSLRIKDSEVDKKIRLKGIDGHEINELTDKTVKKLNKTFHERKNKEDCKKVIQRSPFSDIIKIPLILQQLICLWFEDKLHDISKCDINRSMLALFLEWKTLKTSEVQECKMSIQECMVDSSLPGHLCDFETFYENTCAIQYLSHLAYETLFNSNKENRLSFRNLILKRLKIPNDIIAYCLNAGVLRKEHNISLHASVRQQISFSFFHKSMQEYLAAVYIASEFQKMLQLRESLNDRDISNQCAEKYFGSCKTVADILDQSNVLIMLCGFEPRLLLNVSGYIYNVSLVDKIVVEKRNNMTEQYSLDTSSKWIIDIQACIFNCIEEVLPSTQFENVYIADIYVSHSTDLLRYCHNIILNNVLSVEIIDNPYRSDKDDKEAFYLTVKHLTKCDQFKIIRFVANNKSDERIYNEFTTILATNVNTIETVSLFNINEIMIARLVSKLPKILQLTSLQVNVYV